MDPLIFGKNAVQFLKILCQGDTDQARFIGGCVRNAYLNLELNDIDIATRLTPDQVTKLLTQHRKIKVIPTGYDHGTVTAIYRKQSFEITTLRRDIDTDGRRAIVRYTRAWAQDAKRRDFTINTLSCDINGKLYDPLQCALKDLDNRHICFVGEAQQRIKEDALRILRFFRFYGAYGQGAADKKALKACTDLSHCVLSLSRERISQELYKIIMLPRAYDILALMCEAQILPSIIKADHLERFKTLATAQTQGSAPSLLARLYTMQSALSDLEPYLIITRKQKKQWQALEKARAFQCNMHALFDLQKLIYYCGRSAAIQAYLMRADNIEPSTLMMMQTWQLPTCPITGQDLLDAGFPQGASLGVELKKQERAWVDRGFS